jgi:sugar phosphate permease
MNEWTAGKETGFAADPNALSAPASRVRYQVLGSACVLAVIIYIQRLGLVRDSGSELKRTLGLDDAKMGDIGAAFLVAYGLCQVPGGWLADRLGGRHLSTALVVGWSLIAGLVGLAVLMPTAAVFWFLLFMLFCFGLLQAGIFPAWSRVIADWMPVRDRASAQGTIWMFSRLGGAVVAFVFLGLLGLLGSWPRVFWVFACMGFAWASFYWPWFRNRPEEMSRVNPAELALIAAGRDAFARPATAFPWHQMLTSISVWALCLMYGFIGFAGNFFTATLPRYLHDHRHLSKTETAWLSSLPLAFSMAACILGGVLSDWMIRRTGNRKWGRRLGGSIGLVLAGVTLLASAWVPNSSLWLLAVLLSVAFFCNDLSMGPAWASCADIAERHAGSLSGAMNMTGAFLGALGRSFEGRLLDRHAYELMFFIFACSYGVAALCWLGVDVTKRFVPDSKSG